MSDDTQSTNPDARIGFRDIYRAVGESEARITTLINERFGALGKDVGDHEARIRIIEAAVMPLAVLQESRDRRITAVELQSAATAGAIEHFKSAQRGVLATLGAGKQAIVLGLAIMGGAVGLVDLISRLAPTK